MTSTNETSHRGVMRPGVGLKLQRMSDGHAPWAAPPPGLVIFEVLFLAWLALELAIVVLDEGASVALSSSPIMMFVAVVFGALVPLLASYGIGTNRLWGRLGVLAAVLGILTVVGWYLGVPGQLGKSDFLLGGGLLVTGFIVAAYLYGSASIRNFYGVLRGNVPLEPIAMAESSNTSEEKSAAMGSTLQLILEYALLLVSLALLVAAFLQM